MCVGFRAEAESPVPICDIVRVGVIDQLRHVTGAMARRQPLPYGLSCLHSHPPRRGTVLLGTLPTTKYYEEDETEHQGDEHGTETKNKEHPRGFLEVQPLSLALWPLKDPGGLLERYRPLPMSGP